LAIWFYQQSQRAKEAILADQQAFKQTVVQHFTNAGWDLSTQSPSDLGFEYVRETYSDVVQKLAEATEYEQEVQPLLGWESLGGMRDAVAASPVQQEGESSYATVRGLLARYEHLYASLSQRVEELRQGNEQLTQQVAATRAELVESDRRHGEQMSAAARDFERNVAELRDANEDLNSRLAQKREEVEAWSRKHQQAVSEHRREAVDLREEAARWRTLYDEEIAGPGERERLVAEGEVLEVYPEYDFVMIQGGRDRNVKENDRFVVYAMTPDGLGKRKGVVLVGQVHEHSALATIAEEDTYILEGDYFVSVQRWEQFHEEVAATGSGG
jgi:hypothetical protein